MFFLAGSLPATALIHLRQLSLLGMLARLGEESILQQIGRQVLLSKSIKVKSWFSQVRGISQQYTLPDPLLVLQSPFRKESWNKTCKSRIISWWEQRLRGETALLPSLTYFHPSFMSLTKTH